MDVVIGKQSVDIGSSHVLLVQVEHGDVRVVLENHTGNYLVTNLQVFTGAVLLHVLAHLDDFAGALMAQGHGNQSKRISPELMGIRSADAASFHLHQHIVIADFRHRKFLYFKMLQARQHRHMGRLRDGAARRTFRRRSRTYCTGHTGKHLFHNLLYLRCISHFSLLSRFIIPPTAISLSATSPNALSSQKWGKPGRMPVRFPHF